MSRESLPRTWRLRRTRDLESVLRAGQRRRTPRLEIMWRPNTVGHPRFGLIVQRQGQTGVARNRLRRRLRELARRLLLPTLGPIDIILRSRVPAYRSDIDHLASDLEQWRRTLSG